MNICEKLKRLSETNPQLCEVESSRMYRYLLRFGEDSHEIVATEVDDFDLIFLAHCLKSSAITRGWNYVSEFTHELKHRVSISVPDCSLTPVKAWGENEALAWLDAYMIVDSVSKAVEGAKQEVLNGRS